MKKIILASILLSGLGAHATIVSDRIAATNRLLPLKKITVGPDDQYQGSVDPKGEILVFTHKANLVPHLRVQELKSGDVRDFLPLTADSQEPMFSPTGIIAFTFYKFSSHGDICYANSPNFSKAANADPQITCLPRGANEKLDSRSNPFWKSNDELAYVNESASGRTVVVENIHTGAKATIASGKIFSPAMKPGGHYLAYIQIGDNSVRELVLVDLQNHQAHVLHFALPGISGFPCFSSDETQLYFSHYPNDSNGDNIIDGSDNAVVFRIPVAKAIALKENEKIFPEQLTSLESSCSFPHPYNDLLFATCAFEGSLDVYQMPATGIIPVKWTKPILDNALATSRSYQERILNLNTEKYREPNALQITNERLLNNHILADETAAARNYLEEIGRTAPAKDKVFLSLVKTYLETRELKKSQPSEDVGRVFRSQIATFDKKLAASKSESNLVTILRGMLRVFTGDLHEASEYLARVHSASPMRPLERYLYFELADKSLGRDLKSESKLLDAYHIVMTAPELDEEAHVYYAYRMLEQIDQQHTDLNDRIKVIESTKKFLLNPVLTLLDSETCVLQLILAPDKEKPKVYGQLDRYMSQTRDDYFLRKALYVRGIVNLTKAAQFMYMDYIATSWLKYTAQADTEFIYAREVVQSSAYDQAYASVAIKNDIYSSSFFYEALSLTDDLEAHYGYVQSMLRQKQRTTIDARYKNLVQRSFIDDNMKFVEALLILVDQAPKAASDPKYVAHLDQAIEKLNAMTQDRDAAARYLLLGSCYLEKLLRTSHGIEFSTDLMQKSNRALMLAYDLGRDNVRLQSSALMNLGILQSQVQNQGLAVRFFALRKPFGFTSSKEKASFEWFYARSLFLSHQAAQAAVEIAEIDAAEMKAASLERKAFYLMSAEKYKESAEAYEEFFSKKPQLDSMSFAKVSLSNGFALLRNHQDTEARNHLIQAIQSLDKLSKIRRNADRSVEFNPDRLKAFAYGFLSQLGSSKDQIDSLEKRYELLKNDSKLVEDQPSAMIEAQLQLAWLITKTSPRQAAVHIREAVKLSQALGKESQYLAHGVFVTASAALIEGILHPEVYSAEDSKKVQALVESCVHSYESQKISQAFLNYQDLKLKVLETAYLAKVNRQVVPQASIQNLMSSKLATGVKEALPKQWEEVAKLGERVSL